MVRVNLRQLSEDADAKTPSDPDIGATDDPRGTTAGRKPVHTPQEAGLIKKIHVLFKELAGAEGASYPPALYKHDYKIEKNIPSISRADVSWLQEIADDLEKRKEQLA